MAGIAFPGTAYPEVCRLGQATLPDAVTVLGNGDIDIPGLGTVRQGFTRTSRGMFALGRLATGHVMIQQLYSPLLPGQTVDIELDFANAGQVGPDDVTPRVLVTVPTTPRLDAVNALVKDLPEPASQLLYVVLFDRAVLALLGLLKE